MTDTTELIQRLRDASQGHDEWRAQNPEDACYCISFSRINSLDPECEARSWLADHIKQFPNGRFVDYVVACVRVTSEADQLRLAAADALEQQARELNDAINEFTAANAEIEQQAAQIAEKDAEIATLKTVMIAAAEEIGAHWDAHCDAEGYGPVNLLRRLEQGIPSEYGYTAGAFARMKAELSALRADAERMKSALNFIAEHMCSDWSQRCQAMVNTARAALRQEQPNE